MQLKLAFLDPPHLAPSPSPAAPLATAWQQLDQALQIAALEILARLNSVYFKSLQTEAHRAGERVGIPLAGDDPAALDVAARLGDAGFEPVVVGPLDRARSFDPRTPVYNTGMSGAELARALGGARSP